MAVTIFMRMLQILGKLSSTCLLWWRLAATSGMRAQQSWAASSCMALGIRRTEPEPAMFYRATSDLVSKVL
jgi:hypothetical protein